MNDFVLCCNCIEKTFGGTRAVHGVSVDLSRGRSLAVLGPSGCGKTTTLRLVAGFEMPDSGTITIGGQMVAGPGVFVPPERRRLGMVFQEYALFPHLDVAGNVGFGLPRGRARTHRVHEMLELVGLAQVARRLPHELSGGQQQRVALARALAPGPEVVLMDEPFSNLDAGLRARVRGEVRQILEQANATLVFVTHDQEEALSLADEVAVMLEGTIIQQAAPEHLYLHPETRAVARFVGEVDSLVGMARGQMIETEIGSLICYHPSTGQVEVLLRPEAVTLVSAADGSAVVVNSDFFGHDQVVTVRLPSGELVRSRLGPDERFRPGTTVRVEVRGEVVAFPWPDRG